MSVNSVWSKRSEGSRRWFLGSSVSWMLPPGAGPAFRHSRGGSLTRGKTDGILVFSRSDQAAPVANPPNGRKEAVLCLL